MANITQKQIVDFLKSIRGQRIHIDSLMKEFNLEATNRSQLRAVLSRCVEDKLAKPSGARDGWFKVLRDVQPVRWWDANEGEYFDLSFPCGRQDGSSFGFEGLIAVSPGDLMVIGGVSNFGKSATVLNILGENVDKHPCVLMGNEYTALNGVPSPKFKRRMKRMAWVDWMDGNGQPKFDLLPVKEDWEDYIQPNKVNIIDWINLTDNFYIIGKILEDIKTSIGSGVAIVVLQKKKDADTARGGDFSKDLADIYMIIDPYGEESRITLEKVKEPKGKVYNRHWAFRIVDGGANFQNIREIEKCYKCYGRGYTKMGKCDACSGKGFMELDF